MSFASSVGGKAITIMRYLFAVIQRALERVRVGIFEFRTGREPAAERSYCQGVTLTVRHQFFADADRRRITFWIRRKGEDDFRQSGRDSFRDGIQELLETQAARFFRGEGKEAAYDEISAAVGMGALKRKKIGVGRDDGQKREITLHVRADAAEAFLAGREAAAARALMDRASEILYRLDELAADSGGRKQEELYESLRLPWADARKTFEKRGEALDGISHT